MPRTAMRSDGVPGVGTPNPHPQPNGRPPTAQDVPTGLPYGERGRLTAEIRGMPQPTGVAAPGTPAPPGITPQAHSAYNALANYNPQVTPLFAETARPSEPVTAGSIGPSGVGPPNEMALANMVGAGSVSSIIGQMADRTNSPTLRNLAAQAGALGQ